MGAAKRVTVAGVVLNALLFAVKLLVGLVTNSIAVISDALNSLVDVLSSIGIFVAVKLNRTPADKDHPFGHYRAEPLAAFVVAVLTAVLGFEVLLAAFRRLSGPELTTRPYLALAVLVFTMVVKLCMFVVMRGYARHHESPAIHAQAIDARNDIFVSFVAFLGVIAAVMGFPHIEGIAAIVLALFLFRVAYGLGVQNLPYLMGQAPPKKFENNIRKIAKTFKGVQQVKSIRAHYVGSYVNVEIVIVVNKNMTVKKSHDLAGHLGARLEQEDHIERVFVHVNPSQ